jgi:hypothetical protein
MEVSVKRLRDIATFRQHRDYQIYLGARADIPSFRNFVLYEL